MRVFLEIDRTRRTRSYVSGGTAAAAPLTLLAGGATRSAAAAAAAAPTCPPSARPAAAGQPAGPLPDGGEAVEQAERSPLPPLT